MLRSVVETFIRLVREKVHPGTVSVFPDDVFEVPKAPSVILVGPSMVENEYRRVPGDETVFNTTTQQYESTMRPRFFHLDFEIVITAADGGALLDLQEKAVRFFSENTEMALADDQGYLNLTLLQPLGSGAGRRVNLSNLRQVTGRCRIEDCPIYSQADPVIDGPPISTVITEYREDVAENITETFTED